MQNPAIPDNNGRGIFVEIDGMNTWLSAQAAYDLHQAIGAVLPELVQPFQPWPRE